MPKGGLVAQGNHIFDNASGGVTVLSQCAGVYVFRRSLLALD
jgi:hypothetical protein